MNNSPTNHLILDTDIGSDVDDAMALLQLVGAGWSTNMSITTVYGDTALRAQIAARYCELIGVTIPIYKGESNPLSGREVWVSGLEGSLHSDLGSQIVEDQTASEHILQMSRMSNINLQIVAIGPLTNLAKACLKDPSLPERVSHVFMMGGDFSKQKAEHNFLSDSRAAEIVLEAGFRVTLSGLESTKRVSIPNEEMNPIRELGPAGSLLFQEIVQWSEFWDAKANIPHDPIAVLTLTNPELFQFSELGQISVSTDAASEGVSIFTSKPHGKHRLVQDFSEQIISEQIIFDIGRSVHHAGIKN